MYNENYNINLADEGKAYNQGFDDGIKYATEKIIDYLVNSLAIGEVDSNDIISIANEYGVKNPYEN